ncbi:hypothetical protein GCM10010250_59290 [Streptomyces althioticus]|uniref:hypothetical protein n=1 Tax=Streptomyces althioticus TaxID=83380 RepID=UPI001873D793|nr:hypothetical protein GCM10010250_59290 [Streptomyces althioticus]
MTTPENVPDVLEVRLKWRNTDVPSRPANQFIVSMGLPNRAGQADAIHLSLGQADPPIVSGSPEQMKQDLLELGTLPVETLGRYVLTRERLTELIQVLQQAADRYDNMRRSGGLTDDDTDAGTT